MKNRYLSELAQQKRFWHLPAGLLSALMSFTTIQVWIEDSPAGEDPTIWLMAHAFVLVVMLLPIAFIVRWRKRQHDAWMLAVCGDDGRAGWSRLVRAFERRALGLGTEPDEGGRTKQD